MAFKLLQAESRHSGPVTDFGKGRVVLIRSLV